MRAVFKRKCDTRDLGSALAAAGALAKEAGDDAGIWRDMFLMLMLYGIPLAHKGAIGTFASMLRARARDAAVQLLCCAPRDSRVLMLYHGAIVSNGAIRMTDADEFTDSSRAYNREKVRACIAQTPLGPDFDVRSAETLNVALALQIMAAVEGLDAVVRHVEAHWRQSASQRWHNMARDAVTLAGELDLGTSRRWRAVPITIALARGFPDAPRPFVLPSLYTANLAADEYILAALRREAADTETKRVRRQARARFVAESREADEQLLIAVDTRASLREAAKLVVTPYLGYAWLSGTAYFSEVAEMPELRLAPHGTGPFAAIVSLPGVPRLANRAWMMVRGRLKRAHAFHLAARAAVRIAFGLEHAIGLAPAAVIIEETHGAVVAPMPDTKSPLDARWVALPDAVRAIVLRDVCGYTLPGAATLFAAGGGFIDVDEPLDAIAPHEKPGARPPDGWERALDAARAAVDDLHARIVSDAEAIFADAQRIMAEICVVRFNDTANERDEALVCYFMHTLQVVRDAHADLSAFVAGTPERVGSEQ
jgi:hypothetical protein